MGSSDFRHVVTSEDGKSIQLTRFEGGVHPVSADSDDASAVPLLFVDVETTGLNAESDPIIELAGVLVDVNVQSGRIVGHRQSVSWFEDPGKAIPPEIQELTGITDEDVQGQRIDDEAVRALFSEAKLLVAHNARFDRTRCVRRFPLLLEEGMPVWACTANQIPWADLGLRHRAQEVLGWQNGFFYEAHRALQDVEALIHLVTRTDGEGRVYLHHLIEDVRKPYYRLAAVDTPFAAKDRLKARRYRWDADARCWYTDLSQDTVTAELEWLTQLTGDFPRGHAMVARLPLRGRFDDHFKAQYESPEYVFDEAGRA